MNRAIHAAVDTETILGDAVAATLLAIPGVKTEKNYSAILQTCLVSVDDEIELPPICLQIGQPGNYSTVGTLGNISLIMAKAKQGKTFAVSIFLSAALNNGPFQDHLKATLPPEQNIAVLFDTEQSKYHVQRVLKRICSLSGVPRPENLMVFSLRGLTPAERLETIEYALYNYSNLGLVVIDGIRDLITSINDEDQASMITSKLLKWTEDLNIHIMTVLHQNKGDLNARGHLGTELTNKAETVISITKASDDKEVSIVQPEYCRDKEFGPFAFRIDEGGLPQILSDWSNESKKSDKKVVDPYDVDPATHKDILKNVFCLQPEMLRSELRIAAQSNISRWLGKDLGQNKTDNWINHWLQFDHLILNGKAGTRAAKYKLK